MAPSSAGWLADDAYRAFQKLRPEMEQAGDLNEAATRLRIINSLLFDVLQWDKNATVEVEKYINKVGFVDYIFGHQPNYVLVIEAKKQE